ncbi:haloacid dehalogenase-like hydrolase [Kitasatospora cystarginea]|uniref:Haloacid dehalogenase-like hydrolase n=1 Tax=Kitasatospora cystarginea TaxID=58350 RepID=A0ABN3EPT5_9ACTN
MTATLLLWDIDGTLISSVPGCAEIYPRAFERLTGRPAVHQVDISGRTERDIMDELFRRNGLGPAPRHRLAEVLVQELRHKAAELEAVGRVLPGARETLTALGMREGVVQSVLTGNLRANAALKLGVFGLDELVDQEVGAYGDDAVERAALVAVARRRAAAVHGRVFDAGNTVLIGDTVRDVAAGRDGGARVVAVASGTTGAAELRAAGAESVLPDLRDTPAVIRAVWPGGGAV